MFIKRKEEPQHDINDTGEHPYSAPLSIAARVRARSYRGARQTKRSVSAPLSVKTAPRFSYSLLAMRRREAATAVEHSEARYSCEEQVVCMGETRKKWASAWCGMEVAKQCVRQRERDRRALVRPMLEWVGRGSRGS